MMNQRDHRSLSSDNASISTITNGLPLLSRSSSIKDTLSPMSTTVNSPVGPNTPSKPAGLRSSISTPATGRVKPNSLVALLHGKDIGEDPILNSLAIPCGERSDSDLVPIIEFIKGLRFFQVFASFPETVKLVAQKLELQTIVNGGHVFFEGQPGNEFYIVLDGEIAIVKKKRISAYMDFITENVTLVRLSCGQTFGETALDSVDGLRTASAVATKRSNLLMLRREDYHQILFHFKTWLQSSVSQALRAATSLFHHLPSDIIDAISSRAVVRSFSINAEIFAENSRVSSLMIIKSGIVRLTKSLTVDSIESSIVDAKGKFNRLGQRVLSRPSTTSSAVSTPASRSRPTRLPEFKASVLTSEMPLDAAHRRRRGFALNISQETPPGYWLLADSQEYLDSLKPMRIVTKDAHTGQDTITEIHRETAQANLVAKKEHFTVAVLMKGDIFGEISLLCPEQLSAVGAFASTAVELYCIDNEILFENNVHKEPALMNALLEDWKFRTPPMEEVKKSFQSKYEWQINRKFILQKFNR
eukprot:gene9149-10100_t